MNKIFCSLLLILAISSQATEIYMSRDANGNMIFSDTPNSTSQRHEIKELPSMPAFTAPIESQQPAHKNEPSFAYTSLTIISPSNDYTLATGYAGNLEVSGLLSPGLRESDTIYLLDNNRIIKQGRQSSFSLENLDRGEHVLQLQVRDKKGKSLINSNSVTVHVKRASTLNRSGK